jgi:hypothetical protein
MPVSSGLGLTPRGARLCTRSADAGRAALQILRTKTAGVAGAVALLTALSPYSVAYAVDARWPSQVTATYQLSFAGFDVGEYHFIAHFTGGNYTAAADAKVSAFFGAIKWVGKFTGSGTIERPGLQPAAYEMNYHKKKKAVSVKMAFNGPVVSNVELQPNKTPGPDVIKLQPKDLKNVLDPMAAMISLSDATAQTACNRVIPVFDGKLRYDLHLSLKGREKISEKQSSGQPKELLICAVKYQPIAGHKPKDFDDPWVDYDKIEFALRAVPAAGIYVPYRIKVPSSVGTAVMTADTINIKAANNQEIALKQ